MGWTLLEKAFSMKRQEIGSPKASLVVCLFLALLSALLLLSAKRYSYLDRETFQLSSSVSLFPRKQKNIVCIGCEGLVSGYGPITPGTRLGTACRIMSSVSEMPGLPKQFVVENDLKFRRLVADSKDEEAIMFSYIVMSNANVLVERSGHGYNGDWF